jgi:hypothetical protein
MLGTGNPPTFRILNLSDSCGCQDRSTISPYPPLTSVLGQAQLWDARARASPSAPPFRKKYRS